MLAQGICAYQKLGFSGLIFDGHFNSPPSTRSRSPITQSPPPISGHLLSRSAESRRRFDSAGYAGCPILCMPPATRSRFLRSSSPKMCLGTYPAFYTSSSGQLPFLPFGCGFWCASRTSGTLFHLPPCRPSGAVFFLSAQLARLRSCAFLSYVCNRADHAMVDDNRFHLLVVHPHL